MRETFPYEADASLLFPLLCPDPVPRSLWEQAMAEASNGRGSFNLLAWLSLGGQLEVRVLMEALCAATGARWHRNARLLPKELALSPEEQLLQRQGFRIVSGDGGERLFCGGAHLPPDPSACPAAFRSGWQWVLVSPMDCHENATTYERESTPQRELQGEGLEAWLAGIIDQLMIAGASDIHFERSGQELDVRWHGKGRMHTMGTWKGHKAHAATRLLLTWSGLNPAAPQQPQDGRLQVPGADGRRRLRLSRVPTVDGESVVLRALAHRSVKRDPEQLGVPSELWSATLDCLRHEPGLVLCCGPTGSGKSTTAYALLDALAPSGMRLVSIEDPVEQELSHMMQSTVDLATGWTFDAAIRAFMRQDPDLIFVGEIRDALSAQAACRCALSGHAVMATLHARDTASALARLVGWGVVRSILEETVRLVINQRLEPVPEGLKATFNWQTFGQT